MLSNWRRRRHIRKYGKPAQFVSYAQDPSERERTLSVALRTENRFTCDCLRLREVGLKWTQKTRRRARSTVTSFPPPSWRYTPLQQCNVANLWMVANCLCMYGIVPFASLQMSYHKNCQFHAIQPALYLFVFEYTSNMAAWVVRAVQWHHVTSCIMTAVWCRIRWG